MSYLAVYEAGAEADLSRIPEGFRRRIKEGVDALAASPSQFTTRSSRPPYPVGQLFSFQIRMGDMTCFVDIIYQYSQDEQKLHFQQVFVEYD